MYPCDLAYDFFLFFSHPNGAQKNKVCMAHPPDVHGAPGLVVQLASQGFKESLEIFPVFHR